MGAGEGGGGVGGGEVVDLGGGRREGGVVGIGGDGGRGERKEKERGKGAMYRWRDRCFYSRRLRWRRGGSGVDNMIKEGDDR